MSRHSTRHVPSLRRHERTERTEPGTDQDKPRCYGQRHAHIAATLSGGRRVTPQRIRNQRKTSRASDQRSARRAALAICADRHFREADVDLIDGQAGTGAITL